MAQRGVRRPADRRGGPDGWRRALLRSISWMMVWSRWRSSTPCRSATAGSGGQGRARPPPGVRRGSCTGVRRRRASANRGAPRGRAPAPGRGLRGTTRRPLAWRGRRPGNRCRPLPGGAGRESPPPASRCCRRRSGTRRERRWRSRCPPPGTAPAGAPRQAALSASQNSPSLVAPSPEVDQRNLIGGLRRRSAKLRRIPQPG